MPVFHERFFEHRSPIENDIFAAGRKMVSVLVGKEFGSNGHFYRFTHRIVHGDGIRFVPIIFNDGLYKVGMYKCHRSK